MNDPYGILKGCAVSILPGMSRVRYALTEAFIYAGKCAILHKFKFILKINAAFNCKVVIIFINYILPSTKHINEMN